MIEVKSGTWNPAGRSGSWRLGMIVAGLVVGAIGVLIIVVPEIIAYALGGMLVLFGVFLVMSALVARGPSGPAGWSREQSDFEVVVRRSAAR